MLRPTPKPDWPALWQAAFDYDRMEFFGESWRSPAYSFAYRARYQRLIEMVEAAMPSGGTILDVAGGQGNFSLGLAERGYAVTWNDLQVELRDYVKLKYESGDIDYLGGNAFDLTVGGFDGAVITEVIEHVAHPDEFLCKTAALVRPGGYVFMTTPNGAYFRNRLPRFSECQNPAQYEAVQFKPDSDGHIFLLHPDEILPLAKQAGLEVANMTLFTNPLSAGHLKLSLLHKALPQALLERVEAATTHRSADTASKGRFLVQMAVCFRKPAGAASLEPVAARSIAAE